MHGSAARELIHALRASDRNHHYTKDLYDEQIATGTFSKGSTRVYLDVNYILLYPSRLFD